jgi:hypothetical protein
MKRLTAFAMVSAALALFATSVLAEGPSGRHTRVVSRPSLAATGQPASLVPKAATAAASYSVQVNIVTRVVGTALFRTAIDITNNTATDGVVATVQYCFTQNSVFQNCTAGQSLNLFAYGNFHEDDIVQYLGTLGVLPPGADQASFGTLFVTFDNLPSNNGWEGTVTARTYSACAQCTQTPGTVAIAYPGSLFFESSSGTLVGTIRDTTTVSPIPAAGSLRTNLGVTNSALYDATTPVSVQVSFYDTDTGTRVGDFLAPTHALQAGEVFQFNNVFTLAHIPADVTSCIVFIDVLNPASATPATIEGYINILDGGTQDGAFFEMRCAVGCAGY